MSDAHARASRLLHLSDLHLTGDGAPHFGAVDTTAALRRVLDRVSALERLDAVVLSGDLAEDGTEEAYRTLRAIVEPWAAKRGAEVLYAMGNHDAAAAFEAVVGPRRRVAEIAGVRIVVLDSTVPGWPGGRVGDEQLDWLAGELAGPAPQATVVVVHHPPIAAATPLLAAMELADASRLLDVCRAGGVSLVLSGHYHHSAVAEIDDVTVAVAPAVANTADVAAPAGHERAVVGSGCAIVTIPAGGAPVVSAVSAPGPSDGTEVFDLDEGEVARLIAELGAAPMVRQ